MTRSRDLARIAKRQDLIFEEVQVERQLQDERFGVQNHDPYKWIAILTEEVGEVAKAAYEAESESKPWIDYREELIQVAAVAFAMIECFDKTREFPRAKRKG